MYKVIRTKKRVVVKEFNTVKELLIYAEKIAYTKGDIQLFENAVENVAIRDSGDLRAYATNLYLNSQI